MKSLKYERELLESCGDKIPGLIFRLVRRKDGRFWLSYICKASKKYLGYDPEPLIGDISLVCGLLNEEDRKRIQEELELSAATGEKFELEVGVATGGTSEFGENRRWLRISAAPAENEEGTVFYNGVALDVTEKKIQEEKLENSERNLRALIRRLAEINEAKNLEFSSELHDLIGSNLTALTINLNYALNRLPREEFPEIADRLDDSARLVKETAVKVRDIMFDLRPPSLDDFGLMSAAEEYAEQFAKRTGIRTVVSGSGLESRPPQNLEINLFRIVQEALTNIARHAEASRAEIEVGRTGREVYAIVTDDGAGFDPGKIRKTDDKRGRWGLLLMKERAAAVNGRLFIDSKPGGGTRVEARVETD